MDDAKVGHVASAHQWAQEHTAIDEVTAIGIDANGFKTFTAIFRVPLPGRFISAGVTRKGVRSREPVKFLFSDIFPFRAPLLRLRQDFPRVFPHINPNISDVSPCVFEGNLSELLQQPCWFDGLLDQIADWLAKAASDNLMNMSQGWEPMRTDECHGILLNDWDFLQKVAEDSFQNQRFYAAHLPTVGNSHIGLVLNLFQGKVDRTRIADKNLTAGLVVATPHGITSDRYLPCEVKDLSTLLKLGQDFGLESLEKSIAELRRELNNARKHILFIVLAVQRPVHLIGSLYSCEFLSFALRWSKKTKKGRIKTKYSAEVLSNRDICTPELLQRFSGTGQGDKHVTLIGCGSLGSKIGMHLARGGQKALSLVDHGWMAPHNNSRHAVTAQTLGSRKVDALGEELKRMRITVETFDQDATCHLTLVPPHSLVIDTTASQAVRSAIASGCPGERSIHCALYANATYGILCLVGKQHNPRVDDLVLSIFYNAVEDKNLRPVLFNEGGQMTPTGQGCGSVTVIAPDTRISLFAAAMATRIRKHAESPKEYGVTLMGESVNDMSLAWNEQAIGSSVCFKGVFDGSWEVRVLAAAESKMARETELDSPNETGGALIGHVSYTTRCMTVVDVLPAPLDSTKKRNLFILGTEGLKKGIQRLEQASNGKFTYLGTWHSHPDGGEQSETDEKTLVRITFLRNYEPTVCLIWTPSGIVAVT